MATYCSPSQIRRGMHHKAKPRSRNAGGPQPIPLFSAAKTGVLARSEGAADEPGPAAQRPLKREAGRHRTTPSPSPRSDTRGTLSSTVFVQQAVYEVACAVRTGMRVRAC